MIGYNTAKLKLGMQFIKDLLRDNCNNEYFELNGSMITMMIIINLL